MGFLLRPLRARAPTNEFSVGSHSHCSTATDRRQGANTHIAMTPTHIAKVDSNAGAECDYVARTGTMQLVMVEHDLEAAAAARARQHVRNEYAEPFGGSA